MARCETDLRLPIGLFIASILALLTKATLEKTRIEVGAAPLVLYDLFHVLVNGVGSILHSLDVKQAHKMAAYM